MRIVGGEHRGRKLFAPEGAATRPTSEKVREALFDILGGRVVGAAFADLYAGTGAVGLEALSRGAASCVFAERRRGAAAALRRNIGHLGATPASRVLEMEIWRAIALLEGEGRAFDVVFFDPPYADPDWPAELAKLGGGSLLKPEAVLVVEHAAKAPPECPEGLEQGRSYRYGDTGLTVFSRKEESR